MGSKHHAMECSGSLPSGSNGEGWPMAPHSLASMIAANILLQEELAQKAKRERVARIIAAGPPAGSRITEEAWASWYSRGWIVCPGKKGSLVCEAVSCRKGASCATLAARGLHGDGSPIDRRSRPLCGAKTRAGGECQMRVEPGKHRCRLHGGLSTGPRTEEGRARIAEAQRRRWAKAAHGDLANAPSR
ncbi:HGGxSTG domain-containing protein (plasmid) [Aureimonas ureilytica]|uniref:HGGxSTG domain-containing protein n=1 Tax=Aureimonas ureilytica TaxID=401562 RepID=UPI003CEB147F